MMARAMVASRPIRGTARARAGDRARATAGVGLGLHEDNVNGGIPLRRARAWVLVRVMACPGLPVWPIRCKCLCACGVVDDPCAVRVKVHVL